MIHRSTLLASLIFAAAAPCSAQSPAATSAAATSAPASTAPASTAPAQSATPPAAAPSASTAATAPAASSNSSAAGSKAASAATANASDEPSPELLKEARREGFKPKKRDGVTMFCYSDASLGTKFVTEKCFDQHHMEMLVQQREDQRNQLRQQGACTGAACSGH
jgi:predicted lipid-binding transport protein (Tim44 family)